MIFTVITALPFSASADATQVKEGTITVNETKTFNFTNDDEIEYRYFEFTPSEDGTYAFYTQMGMVPETTDRRYDPIGYVYSADGVTQYVGVDDNYTYEGNNYNCFVSYEMTAGTTYRLVCYFRYTDNDSVEHYSGSVDITLIKLDVENRGALPLGAETEVATQAEKFYVYEFTPEDDAIYYFDFEFTDNFIIELYRGSYYQWNYSKAVGNSYSTSYYLNKGDNYRLVIRSNDYFSAGSGKFTVNKETVKDCGEIPLATPQTVQRTSAYEKVVFSFTPEVSDYYYLIVSHSQQCKYKFSSSSIIDCTDYTKDIDSKAFLTAGETILIELWGYGNTEEDTYTVTVNKRNEVSEGSIAVGETKTVDAKLFEEHYFTFTPSEDGVYAMFSLSSFDAESNDAKVFDTYGAIYKNDSFSDSACIAYNDDEGGRDFFVFKELTAGQTYYFSAKSYNEAIYEGVFRVKLIKLDSADHVHEFTSVTTDPTCVHCGYTTYTCECGYTYTYDLKGKIDHDWGEVQYEWSDDNSTCTATRVCAVEASHIETETVNSTSKVISEADYENAGETLYTATFENPVFKTQEKKVEIPKVVYDAFPDVKQGDWFYEAAVYNALRGFITGYGNGKFGPADSLQRQDFVVILARIAGADTSSFTTCKLTDVDMNAYYGKAVAWAVDKGIIGGYQNGKFGVGDPITREQVATILYRYKGSPAADRSVLDKFADKGNISAFALDAMAWANANGIINGKNATTIAPTLTASRAEIATIVMRMDKAGMF